MPTLKRFIKRTQSSHKRFQTEYETKALVHSILLNYNTVSGDTTHRRRYYYTFIHYHFIKYALVLRRSRIPEPEQQKVKSTTIFNLVPLAIIAGNHENNLKRGTDHKNDNGRIHNSTEKRN